MRVAVEATSIAPSLQVPDPLTTIGAATLEKFLSGH